MKITDIKISPTNTPGFSLLIINSESKRMPIFQQITQTDLAEYIVKLIKEDQARIEDNEIREQM